MARRARGLTEAEVAARIREARPVFEAKVASGEIQVRPAGGGGGQRMASWSWLGWMRRAVASRARLQTGPPGGRALRALASQIREAQFRGGRHTRAFSDELRAWADALDQIAGLPVTPGQYRWWLVREVAAFLGAREPREGPHA